MLKALFGPMLYQKVDRLGTYAAALAYCFVLSLVPFLAVSYAVGMEVASHLDQKKHYSEKYAEVLKEIIPAQDPTQTQQIFSTVEKSYHEGKKGFLTVGFILAIYTSFNLMDQIIRTILFIFDDPRRPQGWTWRVIAKAFLLLFIWICLLLLISISAVEAAGLKHFLDKFPLSILSKELVTASQILIIVAALFGTFFLTFYLIPAKSHKSRFVLEGSLLASSGWIVCSLIFATIVPDLLQTSAAYLALGSIVATLLWAQACAWSIILGACWIVRFSPRAK